jgi:pimeloyl-ACP methyl ester carboxylesterase
VTEGTYSFTAHHRGGAGPPLVCLHGFLDTWSTWQLALPLLERRFDVLAPTLPGHAGGEHLPGDVHEGLMAHAVERAMDAAGFDEAHLAGNSLGGFVALQLAARGRARSVVALAPAGGWARDSPERDQVLDLQREVLRQLRGAAAHADALVASREGRRRATELLTVSYEHIPGELIAHQLAAAAASPGAEALLDFVAGREWSLEAEAITCPVRVVWGAEDRLLPWPSAAARFRSEWLPTADWVVLDGVGHCPQLDVPLVTAELITRFAGQ